MEQYLLTKPLNEQENVLDFAQRTELWEHDLRHGIRSAAKNDDIVNLRNLAHTQGSGVELLIEQKFTMEPVFLGFIDMIMLDRRSGELVVTIHDHKFMANKSSILSEAAARQDYQTIIYAKAMLSFFPIDSVTFEFDYYGTKYAWHEKLKIFLTRADVDSIWSRVLDDTSRVLDNYLVPCGAKTIPNYLSCGMYGGCEFKDICFGESSK